MGLGQEERRVQRGWLAVKPGAVEAPRAASREEIDKAKFDREVRAYLTALELHDRKQAKVKTRATTDVAWRRARWRWRASLRVIFEKHAKMSSARESP